MPREERPAVVGVFERGERIATGEAVARWRKARGKVPGASEQER